MYFTNNSSFNNITLNMYIKIRLHNYTCNMKTMTINLHTLTYFKIKKKEINVKRHVDLFSKCTFNCLLFTIISLRIQLFTCQHFWKTIHPMKLLSLNCVNNKIKINFLNYVFTKT